MKAKDLRNSILQLAVQGKLVPQDPSDEPASVLLERIRAERAKLIKEKKIKAPKGGESIIYRASDGSHYEKRGKGEPVCIDDEIPFEIPESWAWVRLESLLSDVLVPIRDKPTKLDGPIPWCRIEDVEGRYLFRSLTCQGVDEATIQQMNLKVYPVGTVLCSNSATIGVPAIVQAPCVTNQRFIGFLPATGFKSSYLYMLFLAFNKALTTVGTGTTHVYISRGKFEQLLVPLPPTREQNRIVAAFDEIEPLINQYDILEDARERLAAELPDRLRKSILQLAVQGKLVDQNPADEPASVLLDRIRAERAALVKAKKLKAPKGGESVIYRASDGGYYEKRGMGEPQLIDVPFDIPDGWEWARVSSVFNLVRGSGIKRTEIIETGEPCVRYGELYTTYRSEITLVASHTSSTVYDKAQKLLDGEVVATLTGENDIDIGRAVVNNTGETIAFGGDLLALKGNYLDGNFAMLSLNAPYMGSQRTAAASGNIIVHLSADKIGNFLMAVPPLDEQRHIVGRCKELLATVG